MEVELTDDLADSAVPGDVMTITGIVKTRNVAEGSFGASRDKFMFQLYLHALSVSNDKNKIQDDISDSRLRSSCGGEFSVDDLSLVQEIFCFDAQIFKLVVHSLCPSIYGHDLVKAGLVLGLFGGASSSQSEKSHLAIRADPHVSSESICVIL